MIAIGLDMSITSFGISDGARHEAIRTLPSDGTTFQRVTYIANRVRQFIIDCLTIGDVALYVEGPAYVSKGTAQIDAGYLMARMDLIAESLAIPIYVVQPTTLKKFVSGKGNCPKDAMALVVYKKWKIEFEDDRGADKLHAYCLHRYGMAVLAGEIEYAGPKPRGKGAKAVAVVRKRAKAA